MSDPIVKPVQDGAPSVADLAERLARLEARMASLEDRPCSTCAGDGK